MRTCSQSAGKTPCNMQNNVKAILTSFRGKRELLHYYIAGLVDGEGSFSVAVIRHPSQAFGWMINPCFQVYQHEAHREVLELCQWVFQTGSIYRKSGTHHVLNFSIDARRNLLEKVIPFFDRYPLIIKRDAYASFRTITKAMERGEHRTQDGFCRLVTLAFTMNQHGKGRKHTLEYILESVKSSHGESSETLRRSLAA